MAEAICKTTSETAKPFISFFQLCGYQWLWTTASDVCSLHLQIARRNLRHAKIWQKTASCSLTEHLQLHLQLQQQQCAEHGDVTTPSSSIQRCRSVNSPSISRYCSIKLRANATPLPRNAVSVCVCVCVCVANYNKHLAATAIPEVTTALRAPNVTWHWRALSQHCVTGQSSGTSNATAVTYETLRTIWQKTEKI